MIKINPVLGPMLLIPFLIVSCASPLVRLPMKTTRLTSGSPLLTERFNEWWYMLVTPDGKQIITGNDLSSSTYGVQLWDMRTFQLISTFGSQHGVSPLAITPDGRRLIVGWGGLNEKYALVYDLSTKQPCLNMGYGTGTTEFATSPDGKTVALGQIRSLDVRVLETGRLIRRLRCWLSDPASSTVLSPSFSADRRRIAFVDALEQSGNAYANGRRDEIGIFSLKQGRRIRAFGWPHTSIRSIIFTPDDKFLAVLVTSYARGREGQKKGIFQTNKVLLCDPKTGYMRHSWGARADTEHLAISSNSRWLAVGGGSAGVQVRDLVRGTLHYDSGVQSDMSNWVRSLAFTSDSSKLLVGGSRVSLIPITQSSTTRRPPINH